MGFKGLNLVPFEQDERFESFCVDLFRIMFDDEHIQKNGRSGQKQQGVDIFCHRGTDAYEWIGIQCKVRTNGHLDQSEIESEIEKARTFNPGLTHYIVATTARRDSRDQQFVRQINSARSYPYTIEIIAWDDIQEILEDVKYFEVIKKHYSDFFIDSYKSGFSVGRILTVDLGVDGVFTTQYELLIGKIPILDATKEFGIHYYQGLNYISCLQNQKTVYFSDRLDPYELNDLTVTRFDAEMLSTWINRVGIDSLVADSQIDHRFSFTTDERKAFLRSLE